MHWREQQQPGKSNSCLGGFFCNLYSMIYQIVSRDHFTVSMCRSLLFSTSTPYSQLIPEATNQFKRQKYSQNHKNIENVSFSTKYDHIPKNSGELVPGMCLFWVFMIVGGHRRIRRCFGSWLCFHSVQRFGNSRNCVRID